MSTAPSNQTLAPEKIEQLARRVLEDAKQSLEYQESLFYSLAMQHALELLGSPSGVEVRDTYFEDSDHEGAREFAFLVDGEPCDIHGNMGWDAIYQLVNSSNPPFVAREWMFCENTDSASIIRDELSFRNDRFEEDARRIGAAAASSLIAQSLDEGTAPATGITHRRPGL